MKKILATLLILLLCVSCTSQKSQLIGKWKSDRELTMGFINNNVKMQDKTVQFLNSLMGHMTLTFTEETITNDLPDLEAMVNGKETPFKGSHYKTTYKILHQTEKTIVISSVAEFTNKLEVTTFCFETPDILWVYTGGTENALPNLHTREYFRRVH